MLLDKNILMPGNYFIHKKRIRIEKTWLLRCLSSFLKAEVIKGAALDMVDILQVWIFFQDENKQKKNRKLIDNNWSVSGNFHSSQNVCFILTFGEIFYVKRKVLEQSGRPYEFNHVG